MIRTPAIIALSAVACGGKGADENWKYLSGDSLAFAPQKRFRSPKYASKLCASFDMQGNSHRRPLCNWASLSALEDCIKQAPLTPFSKERIGVFAGTSVGNILESENALEDMLDKGDDCAEYKNFLNYECSSLSDAIARKARAEGPRFAVSTACSSSGLALSAACSALLCGDIDSAIVCGADTLSRITVNGFASLELLSKSACKPFDADRDGITLGEAACVMILTRADLAHKFGIKIRAFITSWSCTCDAYHATSPHPDAEGMKRAIGSAIKKSGLPASDIAYYCAHGTGTRANDSAEVAAMVSAWENPPKFSSIKGKFGHTLGASGLLNAIFSCEAIERGELPKNYGFSKRDENLGITPIAENTPFNANNVLTSSFGFGGNNSSLVISKKPTPCLFPEKGPSEIFLDGGGAVHNGAIGVENVLGGIGVNLECDISKLLPELPPIKKRRWAKLQQMALQSVSEALAGYCPDPENSCVSFGTGLGMLECTQRFVANVISKAECEALPTAFTNSVHNAISSSIAIRFAIKGLNCMLSAKELSFECALWQAILEMRSDGIEKAIVGSCDERTPLLSKIRNCALSFADNSIPLSETSAAYLASSTRSPRSFARLKLLNIESCRRDCACEAERIKHLIDNAKIPEISSVFCPFSYNRAQRNYLSSLFKALKLPLCEFYERRFGANYSISALAPILARERGKGFHLSYTKSSTGQRAVSIWEIF